MLTSVSRFFIVVSKLTSVRNQCESQLLFCLPRSPCVLPCATGCCTCCLAPVFLFCSWCLPSAFFPCGRCKSWPSPLFCPLFPCSCSFPLYCWALRPSGGTLNAITQPPCLDYQFRELPMYWENFLAPRFFYRSVVFF